MADNGSLLPIERIAARRIQRLKLQKICEVEDVTPGRSGKPESGKMSDDLAEEAWRKQVDGIRERVRAVKSISSRLGITIGRCCFRAHMHASA